MKILLTGAHFTPAVAVIEALRQQSGDKKVDLLYVGRKTTLEGDSSPSVESKVIPSLGVRFVPITTGRIQRHFNLYAITSVLKIPVGMVQAFWIVASERPDVVVSFGGYVGFPIVFAAWLLSIPVVIHEQTLVMGLANRLSSLFAKRIALSFPVKQFEGNTKSVITGNPLRQEIVQPSTPPAELRKFIEQARHKKILLVTGGNQGAHIINQTVGGALTELLKDFYVIHQTGDSHFHDYENLEEIRSQMGDLGNRYYLAKFINEGWGEVLDKAEIVITRAGINTLTELAYLQKKAVIIPLPHIYKDEQTVNAHYFAKLGMAKVLPQDQLSAERLVKTIQEADKMDPPKLDIDTDAASRIALEILLA